jgi:DNA-3-methyladenine glycosylase II
MEHSEALAQLCEADPVLAALIRKNPTFDRRAWMKGLPKMDAFGALVFQVIGQQLSIPATRSILDRLQELFNGKLPTPNELLAASREDLRKTGMSQRKIETLRTVAQRFADGRWKEEEFKTLSDQEIEKLLTTVSGIGPWTVHGFLIIALGREDVVLAGDLAIRKAIPKIYEMDHLPSEAEVLQLTERWGPWRSLATGYLFQFAYGSQ